MSHTLTDPGLPAADVFEAWRAADRAFAPDHFIRAIGPFGLSNSRVYRLHAHRVGDGSFAGFVRAG